jgi:proteasome lid subunit RPN8/RPN11
MAAHAQAESPRECCGLLIGIAGHVVEARRAPNLSGDPNRFLLDPQAHVEALRDARRRALQVVGFYHSHPHSQAVPSPRDLADALYPDHLHAIVSLLGDAIETRVYHVRPDGYDEVPIEPLTTPAPG